MSHEQPTAETMRPERMNYPHTAEGQMAFNGALIQWQHSAIEALTSELHSSKQIASRFANELRAATHKNTALHLAVDEMMKETERLRQELTMEQLAHLSTLGQLQERPAQPPRDALPPKLDDTMPTVWHYLLAAAHQVVEAVDFNHASETKPLKWTVPWAKVTTLRDAVLKAKMLNGSRGLPATKPGSDT